MPSWPTPPQKNPRVRSRWQQGSGMDSGFLLWVAAKHPDCAVCMVVVVAVVWTCSFDIASRTCMCRAWHGPHGSILHRIASHSIANSSHCTTPHRIPAWFVALILIVCIAHCFVQYGNTAHWIASQRIASQRIALEHPHVASLVY